MGVIVSSLLGAFGLNQLRVLLYAGTLVAIVTVLGAGAYWLWDSGYKAGAREILSTVEKMNHEAADAARTVRGDVDTCWDREGVWDVASGSCIEPAGSSGGLR